MISVKELKKSNIRIKSLCDDTSISTQLLKKFTLFLKGFRNPLRMVGKSVV
mgnify:CR=1 FL=1